MNFPSLLLPGVFAVFMATPDASLFPTLLFAMQQISRLIHFVSCTWFWTSVCRFVAGLQKEVNWLCLYLFVYWSGRDLVRLVPLD